METKEPTHASASKREDSLNKLTKINGISRRTAEIFYEMGIQTYTQLANYLRRHSAEELSAALKEHGLNRPPGLINMPALTRQAKELAKLEQSTQAEIPPSEVSPPLVALKEEMQTTGSVEGAIPNHVPRDHDAIFTVSFDVIQDETGHPMLQTTVYNEKDHGEEQTFQGSDTSQWVNWMLERANLVHITGRLPSEAPPVQAESPAELSAVEEEPQALPPEPYTAQITIQAVQVTTLAPAEGSEDKRLRAKVSFSLSGADAERLATHHAPYRISIYSIEMERGTPGVMATMDGQLKAGKLEYTQRIEFAEPDPGRYELQNVVRLPPKGKLVGYSQGPVVTVGE